MGARHINAPTVSVHHLDGSDSHPDLLWFVILYNQDRGGMGSTTLGQFEEKDDAVGFGDEIAKRNGWSLRVVPEREKTTSA